MLFNSRCRMPNILLLFQLLVSLSTTATTFIETSHKPYISRIFHILCTQIPSSLSTTASTFVGTNHKHNIFRNFTISCTRIPTTLKPANNCEHVRWDKPQALNFQKFLSLCLRTLIPSTGNSVNSCIQHFSKIYNLLLGRIAGCGILYWFRIYCDFTRRFESCRRRQY